MITIYFDKTLFFFNKKKNFFIQFCSKRFRFPIMILYYIDGSDLSKDNIQNIISNFFINFSITILRIIRVLIVNTSSYSEISTMIDLSTTFRFGNTELIQIKKINWTWAHFNNLFIELKWLYFFVVTYCIFFIFIVSTRLDTRNI